MTQSAVEFEWDADKAAHNLKKHGVSVEEAASAFDDDQAVIFDDEWHDDNEPREILVGYSNKNRLLFISFVQRAENIIRIISARRANLEERKRYEEEARF